MIFSTIFAVLKGSAVAAKVATVAAGPVGAAASVAFAFVKKYWKLVLIAVLCVAMLVLKSCKDSEIRDLNEEAFTARANAVKYSSAIEKNKQALSYCVEVNQANAASYIEMETQVDKAVAASQAMLAQRDKQVEVINEEVTELRGRDKDCRTLDEPLPDWFDDWLRE